MAEELPSSLLMTAEQMHAQSEDIRKQFAAIGRSLVMAVRAMENIGIEITEAITKFVAFYRWYDERTHPHCAGCGRFVKAHRDKDGTVLWTDCDIHGRLGPRERK